MAGGGGGEGDDLSTGVGNDFLSGVVDDGAGRGGPIWAVMSRFSDSAFCGCFDAACCQPPSFENTPEDGRMREYYQKRRR